MLIVNNWISNNYYLLSYQVHIVLWKTIAACAIIILGIGSIWYITDKGINSVSEYIEIAATKNQMYILPDSSVVWMESGSKLKFPKTFNEDRRIWLSGNSLFDVYKHKGSTFRVYIEKAFIEVKGTSFRIQQNSPQDSYITLFNGKIEFNIESSNKKIVMKPLQKLIYYPKEASVQIENTTNMNWKNGRFYFDDMPLNAFINIVNQMNDSNIVLGSEVNKNALFTGSIRHNETLEDIADKVCFSLNLKKKEKKNNKIVIHN